MSNSSDRKLPQYIDVDGFRLAKSWYVPGFREFLKYECKDDDIFLATYPKCGTTWMQYIIFLIYHNGEPPKDGKEFLGSSPFGEAMGTEMVENMPRPGVIKTHLPFHLTPYSPKAKYIYVARNPKDCCVSFYHHTVSSGAFYDFEDGEFNDYYEIFLEGKVDYGDYFDHILSWYEHRNDPNVLLITYEELKADTPGTVLKVAKFLGEEYGRNLEENPKILQQVVDNSSVAKMKIATANIVDDFSKVQINDSEKKIPPALIHMAKIMEAKGNPDVKFEIVRKGIVGDWRNAMTTDQVRRLDERTEEKLKDTELLRYWKDISAI